MVEGTMLPSDASREWWREAVVYEIYPQSFNDSDGDGIGDLRGVEEKVDYLDELGVDAAWLTPIYDSPHADNGYDVRDYRSVLDEFGTMADFESLLSALHGRDIRVVLDIVLNHTSDEHEWFQRSRREADGYESFYHWVDGDPDEPPNNWTTGFGGSAWTYDDVRGAWYLHLFDEKQPDLNWRNPAVREAMHDVVRFWLEKGVDGFRLDVFNVMSKPEGYPDGDPDEGWVGLERFANGPRIHEYIRGLYEGVLSEYDAMTVGEGMDLSPREAKRYCGPSGDGLSMTYHYGHTSLDVGEGGWWDVVDWEVPAVRSVLSDWARAGTDRRVEHGVPRDPRHPADRLPVRQRRPLPLRVRDAPGDAPVDAPGDAVPVPGRRDRDDELPVVHPRGDARRRRDQPRGRRPRVGSDRLVRGGRGRGPLPVARQRPHAGAVDRRRTRRLHRRRAVDPGQPRPRPRQRRGRP
jgi:glycosidase